MELKDIIALVIGGIIFLGIIVYLIVNKKNVVKEWLLHAVMEAEKELGKGTGQAKLHQVYDWFILQFPIVASFVPFSVFSAWVDEALVTMRRILETNSEIRKYVAE